jgi:hypothetical protein
VLWRCDGDRWRGIDLLVRPFYSSRGIGWCGASFVGGVVEIDGVGIDLLVQHLISSRLTQVGHEGLKIWCVVLELGLAAVAPLPPGSSSRVAHWFLSFLKV